MQYGRVKVAIGASRALLEMLGLEFSSQVEGSMVPFWW